jgi:hypothetical protein
VSGPVSSVGGSSTNSFAWTFAPTGGNGQPITYTLDYLRDPAGIALQAMQSGVLFDHLAKTDASLTPEAMARAFDLLTPELQSIAYRAYRASNNKEPGTKNKEPRTKKQHHMHLRLSFLLPTLLSFFPGDVRAQAPTAAQAPATTPAPAPAETHPTTAAALASTVSLTPLAIRRSASDASCIHCVTPPSTTMKSGKRPAFGSFSPSAFLT